MFKLKWYYLSRKQFYVNLTLSMLLLFITGVIINNIYNDSVIFKLIIPTMLFAISFYIIFYQISPYIITKIIKE